jgi:hypothetical protein
MIPLWVVRYAMNKSVRNCKMQGANSHRQDKLNRYLSEESAARGAARV